MSTLKATDPCADIILDFIAGGVPGNMAGESAGNYDAVIGNAHSTRDLNVMTIAQIYQLQAQLLAAGQPSTAIGRYQDIRATLQSLINAEHLPPTTIFTEELEDRLNLDLLCSACSYKSWRNRTVTDATFQHLIACQWASQPDPQNGGKSHYDGVGANHASTTLAAAYAMLARAKSAAAAALASPPVAPVPGPGRSTSDADAVEAVKTLQRILIDLQRYRGLVDGVCGPQTAAAAMAAYNATRKV